MALDEPKERQDRSRLTLLILGFNWIVHYSLMKDVRLISCAIFHLTYKLFYNIGFNIDFTFV
jgi:hypothetical protein